MDHCSTTLKLSDDNPVLLKKNNFKSLTLRFKNIRISSSGAQSFKKFENEEKDQIDDEESSSIISVSNSIVSSLSVDDSLSLTQKNPSWHPFHNKSDKERAVKEPSSSSSSSEQITADPIIDVTSLSEEDFHSLPPPTTPIRGRNKSTDSKSSTTTRKRSKSVEVKKSPALDQTGVEDEQVNVENYTPTSQESIVNSKRSSASQRRSSLDILLTTPTRLTEIAQSARNAVSIPIINRGKSDGEIFTKRPSIPKPVGLIRSQTQPRGPTAILGDRPQRKMRNSQESNIITPVVGVLMASQSSDLVSINEDDVKEDDESVSSFFQQKRSRVMKEAKYLYGRFLLLNCFRKRRDADLNRAPGCLT